MSLRLLLVKTLIRAVRPLYRNSNVPKERRDFERLASSFPFNEVRVYDERDAAGIPSEHLKPPEARSGRIVLYLHGGAFISGSPKTHRHLAWRISRAASSECLVPAYRLAPEHPYPAALEDARRAYLWLIDKGYDPARISVAGDSAGGGLTLSLLIVLKEQGLPLPACGVALSPWTDLACASPSLRINRRRDPLVDSRYCLDRALLYAPAGNLWDPGVSPVYGRLAGLPPLLLLVGSDEVLLDDSLRFARRAREAGTSVTLEVHPRVFHVWPYLAGWLPEGRAAVGMIGRFILEGTGSGRGAKTEAKKIPFCGHWND